jgi:photoactive yellow protein
MHNSDLWQDSVAANALPDASIRFTAPDLFDLLEAATPEALDRLAFGVVAMGPDFTVERYNLIEGQRAGLTPSRVIGRHFFASVAPCANNALVAHRFVSEPDIDAVIDYVFTFRMAPRKVRLRMLKRTGVPRMYLTIEPRD